MSEDNSVVEQSKGNGNRFTVNLPEKADHLVDHILGYVGNYPWDSWMTTVGNYIARYIPVIIAITAVISTFMGMISAAQMGKAHRDVEPQVFLGSLLTGLLAMYLAPKALALVSSIITKGEHESVRPELLQILIMIIVTSRPEILGVKPGVPSNMVEELITLQLLILKVILAFLPIIVLLATGYGIYLGISTACTSNPTNDWGVPLAGLNGVRGAYILWGTSVAPFVIPVAVYLLTLSMVFVLDLCRSIASIPRKIGELKK